MNPIRESLPTMRKLTQKSAERNIYCHPNPIARDIFWQRLEILASGIREYSTGKENVLDFGGGSGAFLKGLSTLFKYVQVVDLDPQDARNMLKYQNLKNVTIHEENILEWNPKSPVDIVIATDVLEHFKDLDPPIQKIKEYLRPKGLLCVSLPTENWIYLLGRTLIRKTKPQDHYHDSKSVIKKLKLSGFHPLWKSNAPKYGNLKIPLFDLVIFSIPNPKTL